MGSNNGKRWQGDVAGVARALGLAGVVVKAMTTVELGFQTRGREGAQKAWQGIAQDLCFLFGLNVRVRGELPGGPCVCVSNHSSYLDIVALSAVDTGRFLSRHDVANWPFVGHVAKRIGTVFVDRGSSSSRSQAFQSLMVAAKDSKPMVVFPEGKTSVKELLPFQRGAFMAAKAANVPLQVLAVRYDQPDQAAWVGDMKLGPHLWQRLCGPAVNVEIEVLSIYTDHHERPEQQAEKVREEIKNALEKVGNQAK
jgi:1-acyl-sn-glycerol-3-phosphate acyltransferase